MMIMDVSFCGSGWMMGLDGQTPVVVFARSVDGAVRSCKVGDMVRVWTTLVSSTINKNWCKIIFSFYVDKNT